jgi:endonuclease I
MTKWYILTFIWIIGCATPAPVHQNGSTTPIPPTSENVNPPVTEVELAPSTIAEELAENIDVPDAIPEPDPYYGAYHGLTGAALKRHLHLVIRNHKRISYQAVWEALEVTDQCDSAENNVVLIYSQRSQPKFQRDRGTSYNYAANGYTLIDSWNREHVWPKSHGFPKETDTAYTDLHHLRPCDRSINSARNTRSFDNCDEPYLDNTGTVPTPCKTSRSKYTWEPPDVVKGDIARMMFYMVVRYEGPAYDLELVDFVVPNNNSLPILGVLSVLIQWHNLDPVDDRERRRNQIIYERYQGNRNPFIDHPNFVALIWN